ncbi:MAG TPA: CsbD family protein [Albitalea sp.]|uniref:CsbD family protein n=1 Tax=Piscinibacter sp. TaxID=1903157 RepID=UPI002ED195AA
MNKDQLKGRADRAKGKAKEVAADLTGNAKLESEGKADQVRGKAKAEVGDAKEKVKRAIDKA